ncbi:MAG: sigma-70 family RNA polymerase sigma factor [Myxococcota bacterium]
MRDTPAFDHDVDPGEKDEPELRKLVAAFSARVPRSAARTMRRWGLPESMRDDLVSAGFLGLWKALQNRRPDAHEYELSAYVSRRIDGAVLDEARTMLGRSTRCPSIDPERLDLEPAPGEGASGFSGAMPEADPEALADRADRWARVESSLAEAEDDVREVLLGLAAGHSVAELARAQGRTAGQLQARLARATRRLRGRSPELRRLLREGL